MDLHVFGLANAEAPVDGLRLDLGVPPEVEHDDVVGRSEVEAHATGSERHAALIRRLQVVVVCVYIGIDSSIESCCCVRIYRSRQQIWKLRAVVKAVAMHTMKTGSAHRNEMTLVVGNGAASTFH